MNEVTLRIIASAVTACLFCLSTVKLLGVMQQSGYKGGVFSAWLKRKDNLYFNRLAVLCLLLALSSAITSICFSFLGVREALLLSALPYLGFLLLFILADNKYALKVPLKRTARIKRLFAVYLFFTACISYAFIAVLAFLAKWNGSFLYGLIAYAPYALMPALLPVILRLSNAIEGVFENARNAKFVHVNFLDFAAERSNFNVVVFHIAVKLCFRCKNLQIAVNTVGERNHAMYRRLAVFKQHKRALMVYHVVVVQEYALIVLRVFQFL